MDVDELTKKIKITNCADNIMFRAFGAIETPSYEQYTDFLKSRCFPESRDKIKLVLKDLGLPFYDPFMIIEKTEGRMAEDASFTKEDVQGLLEKATTYSVEARERVADILYSQMRKYQYLFY